MQKRINCPKLVQNIIVISFMAEVQQLMQLKIISVYDVLVCSFYFTSIVDMNFDHKLYNFEIVSIMDEQNNINDG